jgi:hypothetical protein
MPTLWSKLVAVKFEDVLYAFEFVGMGGGGNEAILCKGTGTIYSHSYDVEMPPSFDELPDGYEDDPNYIAIPDKRELGLGKPLVLDFAREFLPDNFDEVRYIFSKRGAYARFKDLLSRQAALDRWYEFEAKATERALREWCELKEIPLAV